MKGSTLIIGFVKQIMEMILKRGLKSTVNTFYNKELELV